MQDDKCDGITEEYITDNGLTEDNGGLKKNGISGGHKCERLGERFQEHARSEDGNIRQKEEWQQTVEFSEKLIDSEKSGLSRTSDPNQTRPESEEKGDHKDRIIAELQDGASGENGNGEEDPLEGQTEVQWQTDDVVEMEMPFMNERLIIAMCNEMNAPDSRNRSFQPEDRKRSSTTVFPCFNLLPKCCLPKQLVNEIEEDKRIMQRMNRIESRISTISDRIERLAKSGNPCFKHTQKEISAPPRYSTKGYDADEYDDYYDDEECEEEEEEEESCLEKLASKFSGSLRSQCCKDDEVDEDDDDLYVKLEESSDEDSFSCDEDMIMTEKPKAPQPKQAIESDESESDHIEESETPSEKSEESREFENTKEESEDIEEKSEDSEIGEGEKEKKTTEPADQKTEEQTKDKKEEPIEEKKEEQTKEKKEEQAKDKKEEQAKDKKVEEAKEQKEEQTKEKKEEETNDKKDPREVEKQKPMDKKNEEPPDETKNGKPKPQKVETAARYSEEYEPYLIKKPGGIPRSVQRRLAHPPAPPAQRKCPR